MIRRLIGILAILAILSAGMAHAAHESDLFPESAPAMHQHSGSAPATGSDAAPMVAHHMNSSVCGLCVPTVAPAQAPPARPPADWETTPIAQPADRTPPPPHRPPRTPA